MKFLQSERVLSELQSQNYNPGIISTNFVQFNQGPAHYNGPSDPKYNDSFIILVSLDSRFKYKYSQNPGPGEYFNTLKQKLNKPTLQQQILATQKQIIKQEKKIPTIPSNSFQLAESLNESTNDLNAQVVKHEIEIGLGPGSYDPEFKLTKPRAKISKFQPEKIKKLSDQQTLLQDPLLGQDPEIARYEPVKITSPLQQKGYTFAQTGLKQQVREQKMTFNEMFHLAPDRILTKEEKYKIQKQVHQPEPGQYFNAKTYSAFGQEKKQQKEAFNSKAKRFNQNNTQTPGIGDYNVAKYYQITTDNISQQYAKQEACRFERNYFQMEKQNWPGPGKYQLQGNLVVDKNKFAGLVECPPVFCSGSKRFYDTTVLQQTPGPGSYNLAAKKKKKIRKKFRTIVIENVPIEENEQRTGSAQQETKKIVIESKALGDGDNNGNNVQMKTPIQHAQEILENQGTSAFKSNITRFTTMKIEEVGPGSYNPKKKFCQKTFNKAPTLFGQSKRITDHELKVATQTIGPGEYDANYNSVKPRCFNNIVI